MFKKANIKISHTFGYVMINLEFVILVLKSNTKLHLLHYPALILVLRKALLDKSFSTANI